MKRVLFILLCICLPFVAGKSFAQRYLPGQKGIQLTLGGVDDFGSNVKHLHGNFQVGLALSRYNRNHSRWLFGADYVKKHYSYKDVAIPKAQFTGEVGYFVPFISDRGKNVFFSAGLSALAGYETTNWNCKLLYDGATLKNDGCFIYGFAPAFEMEAFLSDRLGFSFQCPPEDILRIIRGEFPHGGSCRCQVHFQLAATVWNKAIGTWMRCFIGWI